MRRIRKSDVKIGDRVTCRRAETAYYSPSDCPVMFKPGMVGVVGSVDVPCVTYAYRRRPGGTATFVCVDFVDAAGQTWRAALDYTNIRLLKT